MMVSLRDPLRDPMLFVRFAQGTAAGCLVLAAVSTVDFQRSIIRRLSYVPLLGAVVLSLLLIAFGSGPGTSDAKVNLMGVQPVEAIRVLVVLFLAGYFANRWEILRALKEPRIAAARLGFDVPRLDYLLPVVIGMALVLLFFFLQKDLGPGARARLRVPGAVRRGARAHDDGRARAGGARGRLRRRVPPRLPAHRRAARADVVVALGQRRSRRRPDRARAVGARHRGALRHGARPGRPARGARRPHGPDPLRRRRGTRPGRPARRVRAAGRPGVPRRADRAAGARRLHALPLARPHARHRPAAAADLGRRARR